MNSRYFYELASAKFGPDWDKSDNVQAFHFNGDQPYFYINPWPPLDPEGIPALPALGHWHTEGFVGTIATANRVLSLPGIAEGLSSFVDGAFAVRREKFGV